MKFSVLLFCLSISQLLNVQKSDYSILVLGVAQDGVALLDATFYSSSELPGRDIKEIPHPLVTETIQLFSEINQKEKIFFIHFNHTNPLIWNKRKRAEFLKTGFRIANQGMRL